MYLWNTMPLTGSLYITRLRLQMSTVSAWPKEYMCTKYNRYFTDPTSPEDNIAVLKKMYSPNQDLTWHKNYYIS